MATMKDVARKAGVSLGTVSNVLNNRSTVKPENRKRVMKSVEELGFRSNLVARTLKTKISRDIGLIIPSVSNPYYPELARGVEDTANKAGMTVLLCNNDRNSKKERRYIDSLITKNVGGIILVKPQITLEEVDEVQKHTVVVLVDLDTPVDLHYNVVNVDDRDGIVKGMQYLYENGHTQIAFVRGLRESQSSYDRYAAYLEFLRGKNIVAREELVYQGNYDLSGGYEAAQFLLELPNPPTAILAANDLMAIGCMKAAQEMGLCVPGDVSVLGYDNVYITNFCTPPLTTINQPKYEIGAASVEMLLRCIEQSNNNCGGKIVLPTELVIRGSVDKAVR